MRVDATQERFMSWIQSRIAVSDLIRVRKDFRVTCGKQREYGYMVQNVQIEATWDLEVHSGQMQLRYSLHEILHGEAQRPERSEALMIHLKRGSHNPFTTKSKNTVNAKLAVQLSHCLAFPGPSFRAASYPDQVVSFASQLR
jgi:tRNA U38,U39,U40 pseudouridine synthase TruA